MKEKKDGKKRIKLNIKRGVKKSGRSAPKKKRLKYIAFLPSFITLMNGAFGFFAIIFASRSQTPEWSMFPVRNLSSLSLSGYMIILAMIADMLDGRIARLTRTTSSFGGQLDSLSDAISFGAAPAFMMIKLVESHLLHLEFIPPHFSILGGRVIFFSGVLFVLCAIVRLARFNVENEEDETAHMNFTGLPSPAAAGVVVSLVILHQRLFYIIADKASIAYQILEIASVFALPVITLLTGILMVSRISYPHLPNQLLRSKKSPAMLLAIFASAFLLIWNIQLVMAIGFSAFALFGIIRWIILSIFRKTPPPPDLAA
ncbi:MAG: phosphatidylcholine/phosphatidylserine synthase [Treponema sp.]|nr:phosphatidylcholine/phosphatidylserine synthase [Treponema sp.]